MPKITPEGGAERVKSPGKFNLIYRTSRSAYHIVSKQVALKITDLAYGGKGVGRMEGGKVCFVHGVIPGEKVIVRIVREKRDFAEAGLVEIHQASPDRIPVPCIYFGRCGGCSYQHLAYPGQLEVKRRQVAVALQRIGGFAGVEVGPTVPSSQLYHYRNRITVHTREGITGFYDRTSRKVMDIRRCLLASEPVNQALMEYRKRRPYDGVRTLRAPPFELPGFCQVNHFAAALLLEEVAKQAGSGELLVDAYCGSGFFTKRLRNQFQRLIGLEWNEHSVIAAQADAQSHEAYWKGDVAELLPSALALASGKNTVLLLDPPAQGLSPAIFEVLLQHPCQRILYVSCNIATLARDLRKIAPNYHLKTVMPLDMFPQTAEIETMVVLERQ